jgi:regulator of replication initiation timing
MNKLITHCFVLIFLFKISECKRNVYCYIGLFVCDYIDKNGEYFCFDEIKDMTTEIYEEYEAPISKNINDIYENTNEFIQNMSEIFSENINITMKQAKKKYKKYKPYLSKKINDMYKKINGFVQNMSEIFSENIRITMKQAKKSKSLIFDKFIRIFNYIGSSINLLFNKLIEIIKYLLKVLFIMGVAVISKRFILKQQKLQMIYVVT